MSTDRFLTQDGPLRAALLERFGLFGVRLAVTLIRRGAQTQPALAAQLVPRSGLAELRDTIDQYFTERQEVLKARSALLGLEVVLRMEPHPAAATLAGELERTLASAHDFRELRLLAALRTGRVVLPPELNAEAVRLVGGNGTGITERLGSDGAELPRTVVDAIRRWRALVETTGFGVSERRAAVVVLRSCEAMATRAL
jgi:hypothetical protein